MKISVNCRAVAISKTKKGSNKIVFVTPEADLFTVYTKDEITLEKADELEIEGIRDFSVNLTDTPLFFEKGEKDNG